MAMSLALHCHGLPPLSPAATREKPARHRMEWVVPQDPARAGLEAFIADTFFRMHGAHVRQFCHTLVGCRDDDGHWIAALGFTLARDGATFLEQYLDVPLECAIASRTGAPVSRAHIVEVGNLAASHPGAARELIVCMTRYLHQQGMVWVAFTATRGLLNSFTRLRLKPVVLAEADPMRLPDRGRSWGNYYDTSPQVMFGDIRSGYAQLAQ
ncbi:MAG TPA: thermostable hemolysin [Noviherbaspirillum sp.]